MTHPLLTEDVTWFRVEDTSASGLVRRAAMQLAGSLGFDEARAAEVGIVATELATNLVKHASEGRLVLRLARTGPIDGLAGVEMIAMDAGPGLVDLPMSAVDGHSTTGTLGIGLGAIHRLATFGDGYSIPGRGTIISATMFQDDVAGPPPVATLTRPMNGQEVCGDTAALRVDDGRLVVLLADGLGHGPLAAAASQEAAKIFLTAPAGPPASLLESLHRGLRHTRGAAAAVVEIDRRGGTVRCAGLGNIAAWILSDDRRQGLVSHPGIVGAQARAIREFQYDLPEGALVVLHSDGLSDKWDLAESPGLLGHAATVIAGSLLRDAGTRHDDASIVVAA